MTCPCCEWGPAAGPWSRVHAPPPWAWAGWGPWAGPSKTEQKEWLEHMKRRLEERLREIDEELSRP
jgi:hypothetical protein